MEFSGCNFIRRLTLAVMVAAGSISPAAADESFPATGEQHAELAPLDAVMRELVEEHEVPGAALAVTYQGRLVYARGFGYADVDQKLPVQPSSRFRIASVSKPITAVAILRLVEQQKLGLDDKVFARLSCKLPSHGDPRLAQITVRQCLQHTAGWDRDKSFDPMFRSRYFAAVLRIPSPATPTHVIQCMLGIPLDFAPGERYAYSNFGYCLLGRLIEQITGQPYEQFVKSEVFWPLGIEGLQLGRTLASERAEDEVCYYDQATGPAVLGDAIGAPVPHPYGAWYLEAMDSHGGWIAAAPDLVRFAAALDEPSQAKILKPSTVELMFARPQGLPGYDEQGNPRPAYYACGWNVRPVGDHGKRNTWHGGSLPGTSTLLVRRHDGIDWAVLFNRRDGKNGRRLSAHADERINRALNAIGDWPAD
jgi:N-acyl-D-amino-acid deacylase